MASDSVGSKRCRRARVIWDPSDHHLTSLTRRVSRVLFPVLEDSHEDPCDFPLTHVHAFNARAPIPSFLSSVESISSVAPLPSAPAPNVGAFAAESPLPAPSQRVIGSGVVAHQIAAIDASIARAAEHNESPVHASALSLAASTSHVCGGLERYELSYAGGDFPLPRLSDRRARSWRARMSSRCSSRLEGALSSTFVVVDRSVKLALDARPFALHFSVLGSSGIMYRVALSSAGNSCTCLDASGRRHACKHQCFCLARVLRVPPLCHLFWQRAYLPNELQYMHSRAPPHLRAGPSVPLLMEGASGRPRTRSWSAAREAAVTAFASVAPSCPPSFDYCVLCYEDAQYTVTSRITSCAHCGQRVHRFCIREYARWKRRHEMGAPACMCCSATDARSTLLRGVSPGAAACTA